MSIIEWRLVWVARAAQHMASPIANQHRPCRDHLRIINNSFHFASAFRLRYYLQYLYASVRCLRLVQRAIPGRLRPHRGQHRPGQPAAKVLHPIFAAKPRMPVVSPHSFMIYSS